MTGHIFIPKRVLKLCQQGKKLHLVGITVENSCVVVDCVNESIGKQLVHKRLPDGLKVCGVANCHSDNQDSRFRLDSGESFPSCSQCHTIVAFEPPNFRNLEYFSISHILLQATGSVRTTIDPALYSALLMVQPPEPNYVESILSKDAVLDTVNQCHLTRERFQRFLVAQKLRGTSVKLPSIPTPLTSLRRVVILVLLFIVWIIETSTIAVISVLNSRIFGVNLVMISQTFRQLDIRMRQINYFPVQFLCYYDREYLYDDRAMVSRLQIPLMNKNLNVNNSNYINLFNSLWMILNDIFLGMTLWRLLEPNLVPFFQALHDTIIVRTLDHDVYSMVSWISFSHPAGFKLNNELGLFMGNMFLWSMKMWLQLLTSAFQTVGSMGAKHLWIIKVLCYCGLSFCVGLVADLTNLVTFHIYCFYYSSTRVFNRQVNVIKSLCQLFRGKKYNLLRNRVDNLDNYSKTPSQFFEIDQVLVGTLMFIVLVLLLPTVFAFYVTFFCFHMVKLGILNVAESTLMAINFLPLFVVVLKLKNSNRLQGGVRLTFMGQHADTNYLDLSNKTLTYQEIFADFFMLFRNKNATKRTKLTVLLAFAAGEPVSFTYNDDLRINYLMLPQNYQETAAVWEGIQSGQMKNKRSA